MTRIRDDIRELIRPGETDLDGQRLFRLTSVSVSAAVIAINVLGAAAVDALLLPPAIPEPYIPHLGHVRLLNGIATAVYVAVAVPVGWLAGTRSLHSVFGWLPEGRKPTRAEARDVLQAPLRLFLIQLLLWLLATGLFALLDERYSGKLTLRIAIVVVLTGTVTAACAYLTAERLLRSVAARAFRDGAPDNLVVPGVTIRTLLAWLMGTALPVAGLMAIGILALAGDSTLTVHNLGIAIVVLAATGIIVGFVAVLLAARTIADPISSVRRALAGVQRGDFEGRVPVYDGSQIGQLQLGFNAMVEGLAERERIREAFGAYVDPDVAEKVLSEGTDLAGETVEVTCMFVDVRGFTPFAEGRPADEVVAAINGLFERIVPVIQEHGGRVDKFVGDGLLAVFGAPRRLPEHADCALAAALAVAEAVATTDADGPGLAVGIGLNSGPVVAGNVGGAGRFEFSVIGDTVNVAARVEAATRETEDVLLLSEETVSRLSSRPVELVERPGVTLKGKSQTVRVFGAEELKQSAAA